MVVIDNNDLGKPREQVLMDLIYESNGIRIPLDKIKFGSAREVDKRKDLDLDPNTYIAAKVSPNWDNRYPPNGGFMYRRRSLPDHVNGVNFKLVTPLFLPFKVSDVLDQINAIVPYEFQLPEIVNHEYKTLDEARDGLVLEARADAYLWFGKRNVKLNLNAIGGSLLISNNVLDGFKEYVW